MLAAAAAACCLQLAARPVAAATAAAARYLPCSRECCLLTCCRPHVQLPTQPVSSADSSAWPPEHLPLNTWLPLLEQRKNSSNLQASHITTSITAALYLRATARNILSLVISRHPHQAAQRVACLTINLAPAGASSALPSPKATWNGQCESNVNAAAACTCVTLPIGCAPRKYPAPEDITQILTARGGGASSGERWRLHLRQLTSVVVCDA